MVNLTNLSVKEFLALTHYPCVNRILFLHRTQVTHTHLSVNGILAVNKTNATYLCVNNAILALHMVPIINMCFIYDACHMIPIERRVNGISALAP